MSPDFAPESPPSPEKNSVCYFQSFVWNPTIRSIQTFQRQSHCHCATVVYFILLPVSDHLLPHLNMSSATVVYFTLLPVSDHLLPHLIVSSLPFLVLNNNHSTKDQQSFLPCLLFPFGERSESVRNTSGRHTQTPQKPERTDESRTQTHRNHTAWPVDRSYQAALLLVKQEHNTR